MTNVNLLPWRQRQRQARLRRFVGALIASAAGVAVAVGLVAGHTAAATEQQRSSNDQLTSTLAALDAQLAAIDQRRREDRELEQRAAALRALWAERTTVAAALAALAETSVIGAHYTSLLFKAGAIELRGVADSPDRVPELMRRLAGAAGFSVPVLVAITGVDGGEPATYGPGTAAFALSVPLVAPESPPTTVSIH